MSEPRFKLGDTVFCEEIAWGCGIVVEVNGPYLMRVDFGRNGIHPLAITEHWRLATEEDKRCIVQAVPEPVCKPEDATLENLEFDVAWWGKAVRTFEAGFDCLEEYTHDLYSRECLHATLNGLASRGLAVPDMLKARIDAADKRFIELTFEIYDKSIFWYYYRWPIK